MNMQEHISPNPSIIRYYATSRNYLVVRDYATSKPIENNLEERYLQEFEHIFIDDLSSPTEHIDIEVTLHRSSQRAAKKVTTSEKARILPI